MLAELAAAALVPRIGELPDCPQPYAMRDWRRVARDFDRFVFDLDAKGPYRPLVWKLPDGGWGMGSFVGSERMRGGTGEAIGTLGALLGATLVGVDKRDWLRGVERYFSLEDGIVLNNVGGRSGGSFWYDALPGVLFAQLASRYPKWQEGQRIARATAERWRQASTAMQGDWNHLAFDMRTMRPVEGNRREPEAACGVAYLLLQQGMTEAAEAILDGLDQRDDNPTYEVMTPHAALAAAYLNAERGSTHDVAKLVRWSFEPTSFYRTGWGMVTGRWGDYDAGGIMGSTTDTDGYAFAMNTFLTAGTLAPLARYDARFAQPIAKWILNLANASRLFYRDALPAANQSSYDWAEDRRNAIAYEGLRHRWEGKAPYATGDAKRHGWAAEDFALYGAAHVGQLGALVQTTNVPMILRIDLRATDFLPVRAYPTELLWNPGDAAKTVRLPIGRTPRRLYDAVAGRLLTPKPVEGTFALRLAPKQCVQIVTLPAAGSITRQGTRLECNGTVIDYRASGATAVDQALR